MTQSRPGGRRGRPGRSDPPDRAGAGRRRSHAAAVPVPEHRRLAHRPARAAPIDADAANYRSAFNNLQQVGAHRGRRDHSSAPSSGRTASTRSRSAPTRRGSSGPTTVPVLPGVFGTHRRRQLRVDGRRGGGANGHDWADASVESDQTVRVRGRREPAPHLHHGEGGWMLRFTGRRLLWAIPTLFIISFLVFMAAAGRHGSGRELRAGQPPGHSGEDPAVQGGQRPRREHAGAVLPLGSATSSRGTGATRSRATGRCGRR